MADQNTITTIFRANIDQFSASTQEMKRYMGQVNAEFEEATAGLGKFSDSQTGLSAKIKQLDQTLLAQKKELGALEEQYNSLTDEQKKNTAQGQKLTTSILKKRAEIKKTESEVGKYEKSLEDLKNAGVETRQELDDLTKSTKENGEASSGVAGKIAKGLGKGLLGLGSTIVGATGSFLALGESTREYRQGLNQLETAFGKVGFSAEETYEAFNYFGSVLGDTRKAQETMLVLGQLVDTEKELESWTDTLTGIYATYGEAIPLETMSEAIVLASKQASAEGGLADALEWGGVNLEDFNAKLESLNTEEERSAYIQETLNSLYGENAEKYKELNKDVLDASTAQTNLEHAMAQLGAIAEPIVTMLKQGFADLIMELEPFVKLIGDGLRGALEGSSEGAKQFAEGISGLLGHVIQRASELLPSLVEMVMQLIPSLAQALLDAVPQLITTAGQILSDVIGQLGQLLPNLVNMIIDSIPLIIEALMTALPQIMLVIVDMGTQIVEALPTILGNLVKIIPDIINTLIDALLSYYPQLFDACIKLLDALVDAIPKLIESLMPQIPKIVNNLVNGLLKLIPTLLQGAIKLLMAIVDAIPKIIPPLVNAIPQICSSITSTLLSRLPDIIQASVELLMGIVKAIPQIVVELVKNIPQIITSIIEGLSSGYGQIFEVGGNLLKGLWEGIKSMGTWLKNKIKSFGESITGWFKDVFKINSPSKLFEDEIGKYLAQGIGKGFDEEIGQVEDDMLKSLGDITPKLAGVETGDIQLGGFNSNFIEKLAELINSKSNVINNNYDFDYTFKGMETSKLALHKATLETKRAIGG